MKPRLTKGRDYKEPKSIDRLLRALESGAIRGAPPIEDDDADAGLVWGMAGSGAPVDFDRFSIEIGCVIG